jgi:glutathione S-transferase
MSNPESDKLYYPRLPGAQGGRAEMVRLVYVLAGKSYVDVLAPMAEASAAIAGKNPYKQFPVIETPSGKHVYQALAIMHHAAHGTPAWPSDPDALTRALSVAMGGYDLYQAFGGFPASDLAAKKKFEERHVPKFFSALNEIYGQTPFAAGTTATFADCIVHQSVAWCARRNEVARERLEASPNLLGFMKRFEALPLVRSFLDRQAAARALDDAI